LGDVDSIRAPLERWQKAAGFGKAKEPRGKEEEKEVGTKI